MRASQIYRTRTPRKVSNFLNREKELQEYLVLQSELLQINFFRCECWCAKCRSPSRRKKKEGYVIYR